MTNAGVLERGLAALGVVLPADSVAQLLTYVELLLKWNKVYNLTAISDPRQIVTHHLLDSLAVLPYIGHLRHLADIGSGAGLPGIPLAIARPDLKVSTIEAVGKKASFQRQAKIDLQLANLDPLCGRVEQLRPKPPCDGVISRAFASLAEFVKLGAPLLAPGGRLYAMKGVYPHDEVARMPGGFMMEQAVELDVPGLDAERHLIILEPDEST